VTSSPRSGLLLGACALAGAGLALVVDRILVEELLDDGTFVALSGYPGEVRGEIMRYGGGVLLAVAFVVLALALVRDERAGARAIVGAALFGGGVMWFGWTSFDMHVLERYDWPDGSSVVLGDLLYHGSGLVVATAGWLLLAPTFAPTRRS
jgi:hypothetical protein